MQKALFRVIQILSLCCFLLSPAFGQGSETQEKVTIKSIIGKVEIKSSASGSWREARVGMLVKANWDVRTYVESSVELAFESGTVIKLGENSVVNLSTLFRDKATNEGNSKLKVATGQIFANVSKLVNKKSEFTFETPTAVAAIRGTRLGLSVDKDKTVLDVYEGKVRLRNKGSQKEVDVTTRKRAVVKSGESGIDQYTFEELKDTVIKDSTKSVADTNKTKAGADSLKTKKDTLPATGGSGKAKTDTLNKTEVTITIEYPENNSVVSESRILLRGTVTPGARVFIGQKVATVKDNGSFSVSIDLLPGLNKIVASAQRGTATASAAVSIDYRQPKALFLSVSQPAQNMNVDNPLIQVKGTTVSGAEVTVDGNAVAVAQDGSFSYQVHIPDEIGQYTITVTSRYNGKEITEERDVLYKPKREKLFLNVTSPTDGQLIRAGIIQVAGQSISGAAIELNGRKIKTAGDGTFTLSIPVMEKDAGEYPIEIVATDEETNKEITKNISVKIDIKSPEINKSIPRVAVVGQLQGGTKVNTMIIQAFDMTPQDILSVKVENNNIGNQYTMEPNEQEKISLDEGKNLYAIRATDLAGNLSNSVRGELYYLPGPLTIEVQEPDNTMLTIDDLPPMPVNVGTLYMNLRVKVEDNIGTIPETILYCRVNGVNLKKGSNYIYTGKVDVKRGVNRFVLETEDIAGNKFRKQFEVTINE